MKATINILTFNLKYDFRFSFEFSIIFGQSVMKFFFVLIQG